MEVLGGEGTAVVSALEQAAYPTARWWIACASGCCVTAGLVAVASGTAGYGVATAIVVSSVFAGWSDMRWRRIPNPLVASMVVFAVVVALVSSSVGLAAVLLGGGVACAPVLGLHLVNPRWVGFGDVKLLFGLGALLGAIWWPLGLGVLWAGSVLALATRPVVPTSWRQSVPFGFWLGVAAIPIAYFSTKAVVS